MQTTTQKPPALLVIDMQQGLFEKSTPVYQAKELLERINRLAEAARAAAAPVFYIQHSSPKILEYGSPGWQLHPQLQPQPRDCTIHKQHGNAFEDTSLGDELQVRGIGCVVVAGLVTHGCVRATCLGAIELGYRVILAQDAHSSYSKKAAAIIEEWNGKLSAAGVELAPAAEIRFESTNAP